MGTFESLVAVNVNGHTEKKKSDGKELTYLSWPWAWSEVKKRYPEASYTVWRNENGLPYAFDPLTGYMVYTSVTIEGITHEMWLPVMNGANKAMKAEPYTYTVKRFGGGTQEKSVEAATMFDINKTVMRCLVKNLAMFGLGLYIYAGEDLPESDEEEEAEKPKKKPAEKAVEKPAEKVYTCERCTKPITGVATSSGKTFTAHEIVQRSIEKHNGAVFCFNCMQELKRNA